MFFQSQYRLCPDSLSFSFGITGFTLVHKRPTEENNNNNNNNCCDYESKIDISPITLAISWICDYRIVNAVIRKISKCRRMACREMSASWSYHIKTSNYTHNL